jgi:hypothetical protein
MIYVKTRPFGSSFFRIANGAPSILLGESFSVPSNRDSILIFKKAVAITFFILGSPFSLPFVSYLFRDRSETFSGLRAPSILGRPPFGPSALLVFAYAISAHIVHSVRLSGVLAESQKWPILFAGGTSLKHVCYPSFDNIHINASYSMSRGNA